MKSKTKLGLAGLGLIGLLNSGCGEVIGGLLIADAIDTHGRRTAAQNGSQGHMNKSYSTAFNYWLDDNNDGIAQVLELKGASSTHDLSMEKQVIFSTPVISRQGQYIHFFLYGPSKRLISKKEGILVKGRSYMGKTQYNAEELKLLGANGQCVVNWRIGRTPHFSGTEQVIDDYRVNFVSNDLTRS